MMVLYWNLKTIIYLPQKFTYILIKKNSLDFYLAYYNVDMQDIEGDAEELNGNAGGVEVNDGT